MNKTFGTLAVYIVLAAAPMMAALPTAHAGERDECADLSGKYQVGESSLHNPTGEFPNSGVLLTVEQIACDSIIFSYPESSGYVRSIRVDRKKNRSPLRSRFEKDRVIVRERTLEHRGLMTYADSDRWVFQATEMGIDVQFSKKGLAMLGPIPIEVENFSERSQASRAD